MDIEKYTLGMGDRFARQGRAQLTAVAAARQEGLAVIPVWNKSNREHTIIHSRPDDVRAEADAAVAALGWNHGHHVDADHIGLKTVDAFLDASDFFTIDVADYIGKAATAADIDAFVDSAPPLARTISLQGAQGALPLEVTPQAMRAAAEKFLLAIQEAGRVYRHIAERKGAGNFVTEVSIDETDSAQTPVELLVILAMIAHEKIPAQTVAPKFSGRFNKGVDYVGDLVQFAQEFDADIGVIAFAVREFGLPATLKLSVHSGSDKFSLYPIINDLIRRHGCGLHVKTAGTTWLEEVIGLAESGGTGLQVAKEIYAGAFARFDELTGPYAAVIDVKRERLPGPKEVAAWSSADYVAALRHDGRGATNLDFRQFIHVSFKVAAEMGPRYLDALEANAEIIARNVTHNLLERHIRPIFAGTTGGT